MIELALVAIAFVALLSLFWVREKPKALPAVTKEVRDDKHAYHLTRPVREALPVVLVHGFAGWDELGFAGFRHAYFRGVRERLVAAGVDVRTVKLSPMASLEERAGQLAKQIHAMKGGKLHLVAHSMGGLDARFGISKLGLGERVATLITLGTPHRGTPLASIIPRLPALRSILRGLQDLSPARVKALEGELADAANVRYASFLLRPEKGARGVCAPLVPSYLWLELQQHGASDGLVPTSSQSRGRVMGTLDTDHWGAIGWGPSAFDAPGFYEKLGKHLAADESLETF